MHQQAQVGDRFVADLPANTFELKPAPGYLFIAGGIGITPILSMVRALEGGGQRNYRLIYCTRSIDDTAYLDELNSSERLGEITIHHDHGDPDSSYDFWPLLESPTSDNIYCCGPNGLMESIGDMTGHWPTTAIHYESFQPVQAIHANDTSFSVHIGQSGRKIMVAHDQTILEALRAHGVQTRSSCESGTCGTCKTRYLDGQIDHRDLCLTETERQTHLMVCVSRASRGNVVLAPEDAGE